MERDCNKWIAPLEADPASSARCLHGIRRGLPEFVIVRHFSELVNNRVFGEFVAPTLLKEEYYTK
jgi:hypothetical protein